jgi:hypothetical protein
MIIQEATQEEHNELSFMLRISFERTALAIQFLEKCSPSKENKDIIERMRILEHDTDLNKLENEVE